MIDRETASPAHVLITGGTRGIGRAVALACSASGARKVMVNYLQDDTEAERTRMRCEERGAACILHRANVGSPDELDGLFSVARAELGRIDLFVHCAALNAFKPVTTIKPNQWDLTINVAARAFLLSAQHCMPLMHSGSIIAISSLGAGRVMQDYGALGPAKSALESLVRYLGCELAPRGIRVNAVTAGLVDTDSIRRFPNADAVISAAAARTPAGRIGRPEDVAEVVLFLASPAAAWIIGQTIVADGGFSLR